jgi:2-octaprenyl-6-methoxyphenol hydroxylase
MSLRDIKLLSELIDKKINLGLDLDETICSEFQKESQSQNFIFLSGIDWVYELFNIDSKINSNLLKKSINIIGNNKVVNMFLQKFADSGIRY